MRGQAIPWHTILLALVALLLVAVVATFFSRTLLKSVEFMYVVYDFLTAHSIAGSSPQFGVLTSDYVRDVKFSGRETTYLILYDMRKKEVIYTEMSEEEAVKIIDDALERVPGRPGKNFMNGNKPKKSYYALPVGIDREGEISPGLLIVVSDNKKIAQRSESLEEIVKSFEWYG